MRYKYLFGPVPSRRLGMSLGVDIIPKKVCSLDCVYCEVGATTKLTTKRMEYVLYDKVIAEIDDYMAKFPLPDYVTFSGSGEPTLNSRFGDILHYIRSSYPQVKIAVLTNGTLMSDSLVRKEMMEADMVMPSLDAVTISAFEKINRPAPDINISNYIEGIKTFAKEFKGVLNLEVLFLKGYNDDRGELLQIKKVVEQIGPSHVQLNTLDRPGVVDGLHPLSYDKLQAIVDLWKLPYAEVIAKPVTRKNNPAFEGNRRDIILQTIKRRPCTVDDLAKLLGLHINEVNKYLDVLEADGLVKTSREERGVFYRSVY